MSWTSYSTADYDPGVFGMEIDWDDPDVDDYKDPSKVMKYYSVHNKLRRVRGPASAHDCLHCGRPAAHWAYDRSDPEPKHGKNKYGNLVRYSTDLHRYVPLCRHCHAIFDGAPPPGCSCHLPDGSLRGTLEPTPTQSDSHTDPAEPGTP